MSNNYYSAQYTGNKKIQWKNFTDTSTPLSAANLQKSHTALNDIDQAVAAGFQSVDQTKVDIETIRPMVSGVEYNANTGVFTFHHFDSTLYPDLVINTALEKVIINWSYNPNTQKLELTQEDGTVVEVDLSHLIANPDLQDSDTIAWTVNLSGQIYANIKTNSITDSMIEAHYLASIMTVAGQAATSADEADYYSRLSQSYANGTSNLPDRPTENVDNADYYRRLAQEAATVSGSILNICGSILTTAGQYKDAAEQSAVASGSSMLIAGQYASEAEMSKIISGSSALIAGSAMRMAGISEANALDYSRKSQSYATGDAVDDQGNPYRPGQADDNAKKYCELAQQAAQQAGVFDMTGATATTDGTHGLVPKPLAGEQDKFLKGDGTFSNLPTMVGANGSIAGIGGIVPIPQPGDDEKFLKGNGQWEPAAADDNFLGTTEQWEALTSEQKELYKTADVLNDYVYIQYEYNCPAGSTIYGEKAYAQVKIYNVDVELRHCEFGNPISPSVKYVFKEWNTEPDGTGTSYDELDVYTQNEYLILYAIWEEAQYYLTINTDEGVATHTPSQWVNKGDSVNVEATAKACYTIASGTGTVLVNEAKTVNIETEVVVLKFSSDEPFTLSVTTPGWDGTLEYTTDDGETWTTWDGSELSGTATQPIYIRGNGNTIITGSTDTEYTWTFTGKYITGNIETLLDYQTVVNGQHPAMTAMCYFSMFYGCTSLTTPPQLPATQLADACYSSMFNGCTSLIVAPELPAIKLADACYSSMFNGCTSLIVAPNLPATELADYCYYSMFAGCTSLTTTPQLPATTLASNCYRYMFNGCTSLITSPNLSATQLANDCYAYMFNYCTSLTTAPQLPATQLAEESYRGMFYGCTSLKISTVQDSTTYKYSYRIPTRDTGITATSALANMFTNTGGTFTGTPTINTTYYTDHEPV